MSFGFPSEVYINERPLISLAISQAVRKRHDKVIFFAAAANCGGNQRVMFPAIHEFVIPVRGTDVNGAFQSFNPPRDPNGPAVFGTLAQEVPGAQLSAKGDEVYRSGTSVATPIAAGIAAMILAYVNICSAGQPDPMMTKLWTKRGMFRMIVTMSPCMQGKYYYLSTVAFMAMNLEERKSTMVCAVVTA